MAVPQCCMVAHVVDFHAAFGYYELAVDAPPATRVAAAFTDLAQAT